jgi:Uma2 family endonuclease
MQLGAKSGPEPDIAVVAGQIRDDVKRHPSTAALVVEIADSSLRLDRGVKASLYVRAQVPEYWILDLKGRALEVHRMPDRVPDQPLGFHYPSLTRHFADDLVSPLIAPGAAIRVSDLLP